MGSRSRRKGKVGEREWAAYLRENGVSEARRGRQYAGHPDAPDVVGIPGWYQEVKRRERIQIEKWMEQAEADAGPDDRVLVAHRRNGKPWLVTMRAVDAVPLILRAMKEAGDE